MIYSKGMAFNLYQIIMRDELPFDYRASSEDEFFGKYGITITQPLHEYRKRQIIHNEHRFRPNEYPKTAKVVESYTIEKDRLLALLNAFPRANKIMTDYCVKKIKYLRDFRQTGAHLYKHDRLAYDFAARWKKIKRAPIFINKQADEANLRLKVLKQPADKAVDNIKELEKLDY